MDNKLTFETSSQLFDYIKTYQEQNYALFQIGDSKKFKDNEGVENVTYKYIVFRCIHYMDQDKIKSKGNCVRNNQKYYAKHCPCFYLVTTLLID
jgi:hypothetical protein